MTSALQRDFVKQDLKPTLQKAGFGQHKILIHDDNLGLFTPTLIEDFTKTVLEDPEANAAVDGVGFHWYGNEGVDQGAILDKLHKLYPNKFLLATEACDAVNGSWSSAEKYAEDIVKDLNHWAVGWVDWNLVLDTTRGPHWILNGCDAPILVAGEEYYKQPTFYTMGKFSKFILPESVRVHHKFDKEDPNFRVTVFERPDKVKVAVVLNKGPALVNVEMHDPIRGYLHMEMPGHSIETFLWI